MKTLGDFLLESYFDSYVSHVGCFNFNNYNTEETESEYLFTMEVPGCKKEFFKIQIEESKNLKIAYKAEKKEFERKFVLPKHIDSNNVKSKLEDGILTITIPKQKEDDYSINVGID